MIQRISFEGDKPLFHIFNRGVEKRNIFLDDNDRNRFLFLLCILQGDIFLNHSSRLAKEFGQHGRLAIDEIMEDIIEARIVELVGFTLMPNHFHLIVLELKDGGLTKFMSRLANSYTKYFNIKNDRNGYLFGSNFHKKLIDTNEYLLHLSAYIHRNPREIKKWNNKESDYPWSSYQDYIGENRWGNLLSPEIILDQFSDRKEYLGFTRSSVAKLKKFESALEFD
ncbi:MAG: hypothetical protein UW30_C0001G0050 [Candidatus Giovannonibacteria bacterium GW2011_GWA2_44_13b]|nr:MAG: hypothetical protein UW30_C0001G0050 [Candidatus Giovannonibacteria bacterium GW2011_GWA2_44_13b]